MSEKEGKSSKMKKILLAFVSIIISIVVAVMSSSLVDRLQETIDDIVENELDSMVQDAVDSELDNIVIEECKLSGIWVINDALSFTSEQFNEKINFTSNGVSYTYFNLLDARIYYENSSNTYVNMIYDGQMDAAFKSDVYRTIDFGDSKQSVSKEFYDWFTYVAEEYVSEQSAITLSYRCPEQYPYDSLSAGGEIFDFPAGIKINGVDVIQIKWDLSSGGNMSLALYDPNTCESVYLYRYVDCALVENNALAFDTIDDYNTYISKLHDSNNNQYSLQYSDIVGIISYDITGVTE